mgnify:CR=1 FL=1
MDLNADEQLKNVLSSIAIEKDQIIYEEGETLGEGFILSLAKCSSSRILAMEN